MSSTNCGLPRTRDATLPTLILALNWYVWMPGPFSVIQQYRIKSNNYAYAYPDLAANELREGELVGADIGFTFLSRRQCQLRQSWSRDCFVSGATPGRNPLIKGDNIELRQRGDKRFLPDRRQVRCDYFTVNTHFGWPQASVFSAFVYRVVKDPTATGGARWGHSRDSVWKRIVFRCDSSSTYQVAAARKNKHEERIFLSAFGVVMLALTFPLLSRTKAAWTPRRVILSSAGEH